MCLAIPGKLLDTYEENGVRMGRVDFNGIVKRACLEHVADAVPGDFVLVHVGFALSRVDADEAGRIFRALAELKQLSELEVP
jgi:hydrogenase expression/formation protein HypC